MRSGTRQGCPLTTPVQCYSVTFRWFNKTKKKAREGTQIVKEDVKLDLFTDDVIVYVENPKDLKNS